MSENIGEQLGKQVDAHIKLAFEQGEERVRVIELQPLFNQFAELTKADEARVRDICRLTEERDSARAQVAELQKFRKQLAATTGLGTEITPDEAGDFIVDLTNKYVEMRELCAELQRAVREWLCLKCNTVYPGPPQPGFNCVMCPKCNGNCGPRSVIENAILQDKVDGLQRERDGLRGHLNWALGCISFARVWSGSGLGPLCKFCKREHEDDHLKIVHLAECPYGAARAALWRAVEGEKADG